MSRWSKMTAVQKAAKIKYSREYYHNNPESRKKKLVKALTWVKNNPEKHKKHMATAKEKARALRDEIHALKESRGCNDCKNFFPHYVLDFDHKDQATKSIEIGSVLSTCYNREKIFNEIAKCDLVCANCHRIRTHTKKQYLWNNQRTAK